jgi:hypothetical protein
MIKEFVRQFTIMPIVLRIGLVIFSVAGSLDLLYHTLEAVGLRTGMVMLEKVVGRDAYPVHVLLFIGMVVMVLGIFTVRRSADDASSCDWPHQPALKSVKH